MSHSAEPLNSAPLHHFQAEAARHLPILKLALLQMACAPEEARSQELLRDAFQATHYLRSEAQAAQYELVSALARIVEMVLEQVRDDGLTLDVSARDALRQVVDEIQRLLADDAAETIDHEASAYRRG